MKPILFPTTATTFTTNGLGRLDAISCKIQEERNGMFELEMEIAETSNHASEIEMSSIIVVKVPDKVNLQAFRVYKITKPLNGIFKVCAQHISYQLSLIPCMPFSITASSSACNLTLQALKTNAVEDCPYTFSTDVTTVASYSQAVPSSIRSRLGGVEGSVLDQFGGEYSWDNYTVYLKAHRGVTTPTVTLNYGKNITDIDQEENIADTITGIVPFWQDSEGENVVTLPEKSVDSSYASSYPFKRTVPYDFSSAFEEQPTVSQLRAKAQSYVNAQGIGIPKVSIKLSFVNLAGTEEFKDVAALQAVNLCDNINVYFEKLGIGTTAKIVRVIYDVLAERYDSIEVGSLRSTLSSTINANSEGITALANNTQRMFKNYNNTVGELIDTATAWLTSGDGYVLANKDANGEWKELLFCDTNDAATAQNVLRINQNGIGFSSTGVAGPYTQAWTLDGKLVIGGTNVPSFTVYDSNQNIIFQTSHNGTIWNSTNSSMTANGTLTTKNATVNNATIKGGSLTIVKDVGGVEKEIFKVSSAGVLDVKNTNGNIIFEASENGVIWNATNSSMTQNGTLTASGATLSGSFSCGGTGTGQSSVAVSGGKIDFGYQTNNAGTIKGSYESDLQRNAIDITADTFTVADSQKTKQISAYTDIFTGVPTVKLKGDDVTAQAGQAKLSVTSSDNKAYMGQADGALDPFNYSFVQCTSNGVEIVANQSLGRRNINLQCSGDIYFKDGNGNNVSLSQILGGL